MAHFEVHTQLNAAELEELEAFAREPGRTVDEVHQWLLERGFTMARSSAGRWMTGFRKQIQAERFGRSAELAAAIKGAVAAGDFANVADAAVMQITQAIFEQAANLDAEGKVKSSDLLNMATALKAAVGGKRQILDLAAAKFDAEATKLAAAGTRRAITEADIAAVRKAVFGS
ncbi:MAG: hypothetical protein IT447_16725 [Phycisphaerales bacterium]|nr:hypothetical protein [Phycisphaerales bacterium]